MGIVWLILPIAVFGIKNRLDQIIIILDGLPAQNLNKQTTDLLEYYVKDGKAKWFIASELSFAQQQVEKECLRLFWQQKITQAQCEKVLFRPVRPGELSNPEKRCPYCAEMIKAEAVVCRYCGRDLPKDEPLKDSHS